MHKAVINFNLVDVKIMNFMGFTLTYDILVHVTVMDFTPTGVSFAHFAHMGFHPHRHCSRGLHHNEKFSAILLIPPCFLIIVISIFYFI